MMSVRPSGALFSSLLPLCRWPVPGNLTCSLWCDRPDLAECCSDERRPPFSDDAEMSYQELVIQWPKSVKVT